MWFEDACVLVNDESVCLRWRNESFFSLFSLFGIHGGSMVIDVLLVLSTVVVVVWVW